MSVPNDGERHASLWANGSITDLDTLGGGVSRARAINDRGTVTVFSTTFRGDFTDAHAFR